MQKIALPVIFISAVIAALFYVSQEEHGTGTLLLIAGVLLVGQICATLPFIFESKKKLTGTPKNSQENAAATQKITANQQVIQNDLRTLGEALVKRLDELDSAQKKLSEKIASDTKKKSDDFSDAFDEFFEKINREREDGLENLRRQIEEKFSALEKKLVAQESVIGERIDDVVATLENLSLADFEDDEGEEKPVPADPKKETDSEPPATAEPIEEDGFDEPLDDEPVASPAVPAEEKPATQGELALGDEPSAPVATLLLDAMTGIKNKPFLRGNAPGLSETTGTPMNFVEIGKWRFDFEPSQEEITVRILLNDDENSPLGEAVTLAPGQTLEIAYAPENA